MISLIIIPSEDSGFYWIFGKLTDFSRKKFRLIYHKRFDVIRSEKISEDYKMFYLILVWHQNKTLTFGPGFPDKPTFP